MTEPMSDEQLELYRAMLSGNKYEHGVPLSSARVLLAEVERLRAENEHARLAIRSEQERYTGLRETLSAEVDRLRQRVEWLEEEKRQLLVVGQALGEKIRQYQMLRGE